MQTRETDFRAKKKEQKTRARIACMILFDETFRQILKSLSICREIVSLENDKLFLQNAITKCNQKQ